MSRAAALSLIALLIGATLAPPAEARPRCRLGLVYRPSMGACSRHRFRPPRLRHARPHHAARPRVRVIYRTRIITRIVHDAAPAWAGTLGGVKGADFKQSSGAAPMTKLPLGAR